MTPPEPSPAHARRRAPGEPGRLIPVSDPIVAGRARDAVRGGAHPALLLLALAVLAFNLRTPMASLPPLLADVQRGIGLSGLTTGVLTALPVLCMALCAPPAHRLAHRLGSEALTLAAIGLVAAGTLLRLGGHVTIVLFAGTLVAGIGIAACGVTLPSIVKHRFPHRPGAATAAYSVPMMLGAAVAPAMAVPWAATTVLGLGLGGGFSLALVLLTDLAASPAAAARLAAMTFLVCYSAAAVAPVVVGALHDATGGYATPFALLACLGCVELALATRFRPALGGTVR